MSFLGVPVLNFLFLYSNYFTNLQNFMKGSTNRRIFQCEATYLLV